MQLINHKNQNLKATERLFVEKSLELLYIDTIDSYRVRLNNPKKILEEILYCLNEFQEKRIKHFHTIKASDSKTKALLDEALATLAYAPTYLRFGLISQKYLEHLLKSTTEHNYKKLMSAIQSLLADNKTYLVNVLNGVESLVANDDTTLVHLEQIDTSLNTLFSELIGVGFSKNFLYKLVYGIFVNTLTDAETFSDHFRNFRARVLSTPTRYDVIFRIDTSQKVYESISAIPSVDLELTDEINSIKLSGRHINELENFNVVSARRKFIRCNIIAYDYFSALKKARSTLSEYLDVINLGLSDELLVIHNRALVIDSRSPSRGEFQNNINILDGKYRVEKDHYMGFTRKLPPILNSLNIHDETKEKIKSAIRYLRLGNESSEVEHKFINYWIGLEYIFSNDESQSTINRIKEHFINAHVLAYVKRNVHSFKRDFSQISRMHQSLIYSYTPDGDTCFKEETFYTEIASSLLLTHTLIAYRAMKLKNWFFKASKEPSASDYLRKHRANLEIHFTRIYRLRNEIIHDAATNTNSEHIAANLRYYLTFSLNEIIDFFSRNNHLSVTIEDYFIFNEISIGNFEMLGFKLEDLLQIQCSIDFIS